MCDHDCNKGRSCAPGSPTVTLIAAVVWGVAFVALAAVLLGVLE